MEAGNQMGQAQRPISLDRTLSHAKLIRHLKAPVQLALNSATKCLSDGEDHCVPRLTMEVKYRIEGNDPVGSVPYPTSHERPTAVHTIRRIIFQRKRSGSFSDSSIPRVCTAGGILLSGFIFLDCFQCFWCDSS
jgi:hypothetical protein